MRSISVSPRTRRLIGIGVVLSVLLVHVAMTLMYLTPLNPLKVRSQRVVDHYMLPFFAQKWELFAPTPVQNSNVLYVSCRVEDERRAVTETDWLDVTTPLLHAKERFRISAADRLERIQNITVFLLWGQDRVEKLLKDALPKGSIAANHFSQAIDSDHRRRHDQAMTLLHRIASAQCDHYYGAGRTHGVRERLALIPPPMFSKRAEPESEHKALFIDFDWAPYTSVAPL